MSLYIGLMSGTSMDAVDAVLVSHAEHPPRIVAHHSHPVPEALGALMHSAVSDGRAADSVGMWHLDALVGALFADAVEALLARAGIPASDIRAIGSHGQTVYHGPDDEPPVTVQIGDPNLIAERTGITTVADFRRRDIAAGGQGAPLASAFHRAVFHDENSARAVVNIGGIANLTVLSKDPQTSVTGFDTGPGNTLMDLWCMRHRRSPVDLNGTWAGSGEVLDELLDLFFEDAYFHLPPPKSSGREHFNLRWLDLKIGALAGPMPSPQDVQRTLCELTAASIARAVSDYAPGTEQILVCGGGARNAVLMNALTLQSGERSVAPTSVAGFDPEWVEAVAFSWLAKQTLEGRPGNLPSVTGARHAVILGGIYPGSKRIPGKDDG